MFPGKRLKCYCGGKVFRIQAVGPKEYELYCQKCSTKVMNVGENSKALTVEKKK